MLKKDLSTNVLHIRGSNEQVKRLDVILTVLFEKYLFETYQDTQWYETE